VIIDCTDAACDTPAELVTHGRSSHYTLADMSMAVATDLSPRESTALRMLRNAGILTVRNSLAVTVTTAIREAIRCALVPAFKAHPAIARGVGGAAIGLPVLLLLAGLVRDVQNGHVTPANVTSRVTLLLLAMGGGISLGVTGTWAAAAPGLVAAELVYCVLRDAIQFHLPVSDNLAAGSFGVHAFNSVAYVGNQVGVSTAMDALIDYWTPGLGETYAAVLSKSMINTFGEMACDVTHLFTHWLTHGTKADEPLRLGLSLDRPGKAGYRERLVEKALSHATARISVFASTTGLASGLQDVAAFAGDHGDLYLNAITAAPLGLGYVPYFYTTDRPPPDTTARRASEPVAVPRGTDAAPAAPAQIVGENEALEVTRL
jgi:hypothetical protein